MKEKGVSKKEAIELRILQRKANEKIIDLELKKLKETQEQQGTDHTSQYKETSTYVKQTPLSEGLPSKSPSTVTKVAGDDDIKAMIIGHEGVRNRPYKDSLGL